MVKNWSCPHDKSLSWVSKGLRAFQTPFLCSAYSSKGIILMSDRRKGSSFTTV